MGRKSITVSALALGFGLLASQSALAQSQPDQLRPLDKALPAAIHRSNFVGHTDSNRTLHVAVSLPYSDQGGMEAFADAVSNPNSPYYHQFLSPQEVGERFGPTRQQVQSVANYLEKKGFKINLIAKNHLSILADCTVAQAEEAFLTSINDFHGGSREPGNANFFAYTQPLQLPANIAPLVLDISGLESYTKPQFRALTPTQTRSLYNLAPMWSSGFHGEGRNVAISNFDGFRLSNVPLYYSQFGLPVPAGGVGSNITVVPISGGAGSGAAQGEGDLDIQMVLGMAPLCNFTIYDGGGSDLIGTLTREVNDNKADVISESYGWSLDPSTATAAHNLHLSMTAQGITYMAASGDSGTTIEPYSYPNYEPEVLMVGGTTATVNSSGTRTSEVGWSGSGGGWSTNSVAFNTRPSWQAGTGVPTNINFRMSPDVAIHASSSSGAYYFYLNGGLTNGYIGTSFACPVFAGSLAVAEQKLISLGGLAPNGAGKQRFGRIQDLFYAQNGRSDVWFDITSGNNGTLPNGATSNATAGWDMVTGWGAINFDAFVASQSGPATIPNPPTNLAAVAGNGQVALTWTASAGATGYNVKRATTSGGPYTTVGTSASPAFTNTGLTNGTPYYYVVTATNTAGESGNSNQASATPSGSVGDFTFTVSPISRSVNHNSSTSFTVTVTGTGGFTGLVSLSVTGLPASTTGTFTPSSVSGTGTSTFKVTTVKASPTGTYTLTLKGTSGALLHSKTVTLTINRR